ncbi:CAP Gly-rich domain-containing protein [Pyronema domesticum]|uniref:Similar to Cell polarity protein alp11 acc. no. Q10235 n=1 Tax=Pyronema omphalodes (strain CBS 100304) TaxID=1076935 RepID=U4L8I7_PYROM|nr:CAP Gly-rich domain-containing protein [Pyronema domesticum]CCX06459.1 Similar to Cell polarity protein alp11; acc. no. Q10235 [Pyronema omphalodes CBS 100304]
MQTAADVTVLVSSDNSFSERRINPSWTISALKAKLYPITGIPVGSQQLTLRLPQAPAPINIVAVDEDATQLSQFLLQHSIGAEIHVTDLRPPSARPNYRDVSEIEKYEMPKDQYEKRTDSVRAWKQRNNLGRFDPEKDAKEAADLERRWKEVNDLGIEVGKRCRIGGVEAQKRGTVRFVGLVKEIPNGGLWVGVELDEPVGKNDGSIQGVRYFQCKPNFGSFQKPERVEIGEFEEIDDFEDLEEM